MKAFQLVFLLVLSLFLLFGCTQVPACGDGICNGNEISQTCEIDCGVTPIESGSIQVSIIDANTGAPIEGIELRIVESNKDSCAINISNPFLLGSTDSNGFFLTKLEAYKKYTVVPVTYDKYYTNFDYKCATISPNETSVIKYALVKLPAKPLCQQLDGTIEMAVGKSIDVNGLDGSILQLKLDDYFIDSMAEEYDWVNMYQAEWVLTYPNGIPKVWSGTPHVKLNEIFKDSFYNTVDFVTTCWKEGNELPFAIVSVN